MPTTRRSTGSIRGRSGPTKGQSIISFHNKVTKSVPKDTKKALVSPPAVAKVEASQKDEPAHDEVDEIQQSAEEVEEEEEEVNSAAIPDIKVKPEAEIKAEKISEAQIGKYWKAIEKERLAPRVHQKELSRSEQILRYFDVSSQYGVSHHPSLEASGNLGKVGSTPLTILKPCVGISRTKRWYRADRLGLSPPIEVLAVLLKEEEARAGGTETAHIDKILNSGIAVAA